MKKWLILIGCSLMLCGCTESNIVSKGGELAPNLEAREGIELDWQQAFDDLESEYAVSEEPIVSLFYFMDEEEDDSKSLYINAMVDSDLTPSEAAELATRMLKSLNNAFSQQDFTIDLSSRDSYGSFFEQYNVGIRMIPEDQAEDQSMALVDDLIMAGEDYRLVRPNR